MDVGTLLIADTQSAKLVQPGKGPFHNPSPPPEATAMCCASQAKAECHGRAALAGLILHHSRGHRARNLVDGVDAPLCLAATGWYPRA